jgi:hypothetical protein
MSNIKRVSRRIKIKNENRRIRIINKNKKFTLSQLIKSIDSTRSRHTDFKKFIDSLKN